MRIGLLLVLVAAVSALGACAPAAPRAPAAAEPFEALAPAMPEAAMEAPAPEAAPPAIFQTGPETISSDLQYGDQKIIKNAELRILVAETDIAVDGVTQIASDVRGYIISTRIWSQDHFGTNYNYATITLGVPVDQFETVLRRLRGLAVRVLEEQATGEDVTDQFVDLQAQLTNLEATRDRVRGFLDQARTVDEALKINQQLSQIEKEIEQIRGRMNYIEDRAAFSTITVNIEPELPEVVLTPTPTRTPQPVQPLGPWDPGRTAARASRALASTYRVIVDILIWFFLVLVPVLGPPIVLLWLAVWFWRRRNRPEKKR